MKQEILNKIINKIKQQDKKGKFFKCCGYYCYQSKKGELFVADISYLGGKVYQVFNGCLIFLGDVKSEKEFKNKFKNM